MKRKNATRTALFHSILSLMLCVSMLVSTTFAWFTDSVTSGVNTIAAGNLDVELYHGKDADPVDKVNEETLLFTDVGGNVIDQWEPGVVAFTNLKVANEGTLALKYQLSINSTEMNYVQYEDGSVYTLADALKVAVVEKGVSGDRATVIAAGEESGWDGLKSFTLSGVLEADKKSETYGIVIYWQPGDNETDNLFNMNNGKTTSDEKPLTITLGVNLFATQEMYEDDSFGPDYDKLAPWTGSANTEWYNDVDTEFVITSAEELAGLAQVVNSGTDTFTGKTVKLAASIDLNDAPWTPIGIKSAEGEKAFTRTFNGSFIADGNTIYNLYVVGGNALGLFGRTGTGAHIEGVNIDGAYISGEDYVGAVAGYAYLSANCIKNCTVTNATVIAAPFLKADGVTYDGGAKAGAIVGYALNGNLSGNTVKESSVLAYRDLGSVAGMLNDDGIGDRTLVASGNTVENVTLSYFDLNGAAYDDDKVNQNMGDVVGRLGAKASVGTNTVSNVTRKTLIEYTIDGVQYHKDVDTGTATLYKVTDDAPTELVVPEGVTTIGERAFSGNTTVKNVTMPNSLTRIARKAFDGSAVEKVVLNEGLVEIENEAFSKATKLKEINFPSTLTTVGYQAFRLTAFETLNIPSTLTNIGEGAFRDLANLTSITIKGDAVIANYAFRSCALLETVYILGENTTFTGTSQVFTNNDSTNSGVVNVFVPNEAVKQGLLNATGNDASLNITVCGVVNDSDELSNALDTPNGSVLLPAGNYTFPTDSFAEGVTLYCEEGTVFDGKTSLNINGATVVGATFTNDNDYLVKSTTINGIFKDCVFTDCDGLRSCYAGETVVFENCVFDTDFYGVHFDGGANDVVFKNCTFTGFNTFGAALTKLTMEDCTFKYNGKGGYNGINMWGNTDMIRCTFVFDGTAGTEWVDLANNNKTVTFTDCVVTDGTKETPIEEVVGNFETGNTVIVDGIPVVFFNDDLKTAIGNGATKVLLREGEYDLNGNQKDGLTLVGVGNGVKVANTTKYASGSATGAIWKAVNLQNVTITNTVYTMADGGNATFTNVNFAAGFRQGYGKNVVFTDCTFGSNSEGYALHFQTDSASEGGVIKLNGCEFEVGKVHLGGKRAYEFTGCDFAAGTDFQVWSNITLDGCTVDGEAVTAENMATLFPSLNAEKVTIK